MVSDTDGNTRKIGFLQEKALGANEALKPFSNTIISQIICLVISVLDKNERLTNHTLKTYVL